MKATFGLWALLGAFKKRNFIFVLAALLLHGLWWHCSIGLAKEDKWMPLPPMPHAKNTFATAVVDGKIYTFGGRVDPFDGLQSVEEFDPATMIWTIKSDMPTGRRGPAAAAVDGKIYLFGGFAGPFAGGEPALATVEVYDPATDTWSKKDDMPTERGFMAAEVVEGKIYVIGGFTKSSTLAVVEEYDPKTGKWTKKADMPFQNSHFGSGVVGKQIYVVGGFGNSVAVAEYDPLLDKWEKKTPMPRGRVNAGVGVVDGFLYAIGGIYKPYATVLKYDPKADRWTQKKAEMPTARGALGVAVVNGEIYAMGGAIATPWQEGGALAKVEKYIPGEGNEESWAVSPHGKLATTWGALKARR